MSSIFRSQVLLTLGDGVRGSSVKIEGCNINNTGEDGLDIGSPSSVINNSVIGVKNFALKTASGATGYGGNVFTNDSSSNEVDGGTQIGQNVCGVSLCP